MANTSSAKKAIRVSKRKNTVNLRRKRSYREATKEALTLKGKKATEAMSKAFKEIDKAAKRNILHKNTAARQKSKLAKALNSKKA